MKLIRPGMGTENSLLVISAIIKMIRPINSLEIGAGDSSVAIANALLDAKSELINDQAIVNSANWFERKELLIPCHAMAPYNPKFISIDNFSSAGCAAKKAWSILRNKKYNSLSIETIECDFYELPFSFFDDNAKFDLIWIDAGTLVDDVRFVGTLWNHLSNGGFMFLHEPYFTTTIKDTDCQKLAVVRTPLWEFIKKSNIDNIDILSIPEIYKYRQGGLGIIRKQHTWENNRHKLFQEEMINVGEAPIKYSVTGFLSDKISTKNSLMHHLGLLKNENIKMIFYAVGLGASTVKKIQGLVKLNEKNILRALAKLIHANMIYKKGELYTENIEIWSNLSEANSNANLFVEFEDSQLEDSNVLDLIVAYLSPYKKYSESYISNYCSCFTRDFARLRRKLIDTKRLIRNKSIYSRP